MKVVILAHCRHPIAEPYQGGLEMHTALLADELAARGHQVTLVAKQGSRSRARVLPVIPADVHPGANRAHDQVLDQALGAVVAELDADVIVNNSLSAVPYLRLTERPVLTLLHTPADLERVRDVVSHPAWRPSARHAWAGVSRLTSEAWSVFLPGVHCVPNGIDLVHWSPQPRHRPRRRHAVWTGRITREKGLHLAVDAARRAGFSLAFSGPVADRHYFEAEIRPRLGPDVHYAGHLDHRHLPRFLQTGAVYVFSPLWPEPFGLALVEALAGGTPAAALPNGAVQEILTPAGGVLSPDAELDSLAAAIVEAAALDRGAVAASVQHLDKAIMIDSYERLLGELVDRTPTFRSAQEIRTQPVGTPEQMRSTACR